MLVEKALEARLHESAEWRNLLHFDGKKSRVREDSGFFLSENGHRDPKAELIADILAMSDTADTADTGDTHALCRFPARAEYIARGLGLSSAAWPLPGCPAYEEFRQKVGADEIWLSFAAENNSSPSSMMGHIFLKLTGDVDGVRREHAFSFFAAIPLSNLLRVYAAALTGTLDGIYALTPYSVQKDQYLYVEDRALWEFRLAMSSGGRERLLMHMWELKEKIIYYDFVSYNCGTAGVHLLETAEPGIIKKRWKPFTTPLEYLKDLDERGAISAIEIAPTAGYLEKIKKYGLKDILSAPKSSKISLYYQYNDKSLLGLSIMPVYTDILDPNTAYYDYLETKFLSVDLQYAPKDGDIYLDRLDLITLKSIIDASTSPSFSKYFSLRLENNLRSTNFRLRPSLEFGLGYAYSLFDGFTPYLLPKLGYRYDNVNNAYLSPEVGLAVQPHERIRLIASAEFYLDAHENNRGYKSRYGGSLAVRLGDDFVLYTGYAYYGGADKDRNEEFTAGLSYFF